jgi:putative oxidoreductase
MAAGIEEGMFAQLPRFTDLGLLLLRLMVGIVFFSSGLGHVRNPEERGKSIGMSKGFTIILGLAELAGSLGVFFGVLTQLAAIG